jgi:hypothetical protein
VIILRRITHKGDFLFENLLEGGSSFVQHRPQYEPLDVEGFLASLRFEHRNKLDQLAIEIGSFEGKN